MVHEIYTIDETEPEIGNITEIYGYVFLANKKIKSVVKKYMNTIDKGLILSIFLNLVSQNY
ncbi:hypothetical protein [Rickettsia endosymbiont of Urophora cardui]|uniref:hypothetical protein n=1 Tax=Rickettsia endosymbiont of Urophora cardui TaxID=3066265 RepID=UPI00313B0DA8